MQIPSYTTSDDVRDALGVSEEELEDTSIETSINWFILRKELQNMGSTITSDYATVKAKATKTDAELDFYEAVRIFSTYVLANHLVGTSPFFAPKTITEDKSSITRYSDSPYKAVIITVRANYIRFKKMLEEAYATYSSGSATTIGVPSLMGVASPTYDPVTGS